MDTNKLILSETLRFFFNVVTYRVDKHGTETNNNLKMTKKKFLEALDTTNFRVKLVDKYPEIMDNDVIYVRRDGRTVWIKEVEK